jgi:hypothetical protein
MGASASARFDGADEDLAPSGSGLTNPTMPILAQSGHLSPAARGSEPSHTTHQSNLTASEWLGDTASVARARTASGRLNIGTGAGNDVGSGDDDDDDDEFVAATPPQKRYRSMFVEGDGDIDDDDEETQ